MTKWCLMLKRGLSTILHHTSFFTEKFERSPGSIKEVNVFFFLQGGFDISDIVFGCDCTAYNPSPTWELSLLTQFLGITTLQSLFLEKHCKEA